MPIADCPDHERLFDLKRQAWIAWSRMYVDMVQHLCDLLDAEHIACADSRVTQTCGARCPTSTPQARYEQSALPQ
jgi:hypothetical protein